MNSPLFASRLLPALLLASSASCFGSRELSGDDAKSSGPFEVVTINVADGDVWALNRPIVITFNHPVDPTSLGFSSIVIRPVDGAIIGNPVTGSFEIQAGSDDRAVVFRPTCPTDDLNSNGAFLPGGFNYEITLPTQATYGGSVLRDIAGHGLSVGLTRYFRSPIDPVESLFLDTVVGPAILDPTLGIPNGFNMFTDPDPLVQIAFNQSVDASPANLNNQNITLLYSDDEIGTAGELTFDPSNIVPGEVLLADNCTSAGALIYYQIAGLLPVNRNLRVEVSSLFADLSGQVNAEKQISAPFATPTLASYYGDGSFVSDDGTVDEMSDFFADSSLIDLDAEMPYPGADFTFGRVTASFDFPGLATGSEVDLIVDDFQTIELETDGMFNFSDSTGRAFVVENGVLAVDDLSIAANGVLRGTGSNPLVIYATGNVDIQGVLDVSGEHAPTPPAITKPTIPEWGAEGNCGGGDGGAASQQTTAETWRAESGKGAFNLGTGGEGGEGSVTWLAQTPPGLAFPPEFEPDFEAKLAAGGAGGTFAMTPNESVLFDEWSGSLNPSTHDDEGSDLRLDRHTVFETGGTVDMTEFAAYFLGGEDGIRGNSWRDPDGVEPPSNMGWFGGQFGGYGMEDVIQDEDTSDKTSGFDSPWTTNPPSTGGTPPFSFAHPTNGPDAGKTNNSVFGAGTTTGDDFWGTRYNGFDSPPSLVHGELASPWAGVGGGGSGDSQVIERLDADANSIMDVLGNFFPDAQFPYGSTRDYWKGAAGGGGGGQLQIMSIGAIILGQNAQVLANGGSGNGGESVWGLTQQVSGSGGGSGGHIILQSATGLNLSAIDLGADPLTAPAQKVIQAVGGRRGWSASELVNLADGVTPDGNSDFMVGRGGAGGNGVIQVHVPEPVNDIVWHPTSQAAAVEYITHNVAGGPADTTRVEDLLNQVAAPRPYSLISVFSPITQVQTKWMDTGLANLRSPASLPGPWPGFENTLLMFDGVDFVSGDVLTTGESVSQGDAIAAGGTATATLGTNQVVLRDVTAPAPPDDLDLEFTRNPQLLVGYDFIVDSSSNQGFEIVSATYDEVTDTLTLDTSAVDGSVVLSGNPGNPAWEIRERFFRLSTSGFKDRLPSQANVNFMFQGASDSSDPATYSAWISDLSSGTLDGSRFIRIRVTFDIDAGGLGLGIASERPALEYFKLPFTW